MGQDMAEALFGRKTFLFQLAGLTLLLTLLAWDADRPSQIFASGPAANSPTDVSAGLDGDNTQSQASVPPVASQAKQPPLIPLVASISFGETVTGVINSPGQTVTYTFSGANGDPVLVRMTDTTGTGFDPEFRIYRPDGMLLCSTWDFTLAEKTCTMDAGGTHTILVGDYGGDETGSYTLSLSGPSCPALPDLVLTKSGSPNPVTVGSGLTYLLTVTNAGSTQATGVTVVDNLPTSVAFVSATTTQGNCTSVSNTVTCNLGGLAGGANATITIVVSPTVAGALANSATVTANESDANPANNTALQTTTAIPGCTGTATPVDVILAIDRSGSIWGVPLAKEKEAAIRICGPDEPGRRPDRTRFICRQRHPESTT